VLTDEHWGDTTWSADQNCSDSSMQSTMMSFKHLKTVEQLLKLKAYVIWKV